MRAIPQARDREAEWSFWEKRHRRQSREGSSERVGEGASVKRAGTLESNRHKFEDRFRQLVLVDESNVGSSIAPGYSLAWTM